METTIDRAGRLVIPKPLRDKAGLTPGLPLEIRWFDGHLEIEPKQQAVQIEPDGDFFIAVSQEPAEPLTLETVNETLDELRSRNVIR